MCTKMNQNVQNQSIQLIILLFNIQVGLYVPGGTAVLPSTALMLGIPAQVAGCKEIVLATPPRADGSISPEILYVAKKVGASKILLAGRNIRSVNVID